jgi:hypothetical protein
MENFNFNRANINTKKRKYRIKKSKKIIIESEINLINPIIQASEIQLFKMFWSNQPIKYKNENWEEFIKE